MGDVKAKVMREIDQPIEKIWAVVSNFANVGWALPGVPVTSEGSGVGMGSLFTSLPMLGGDEAAGPASTMSPATSSNWNNLLGSLEDTLGTGF